ncbi:MAG TPA: hypothetical protein VF109_12215 [Mycobacteriales bacterium]
MTAARVVLVGSGSLARAVCSSLAVASRVPLAVTVLARSAATAAEVAYVAGTRAVLAGRPVTVDPLARDLTDPAALADAIGTLDPAVVLVLASYQSPWERMDRPSGWTDFAARAGTAATLPLQAALAADVAAAVATAAPGCLLLNGCFPDAVNPLLAACGLPVHCGIGNAAILAATLQAALGLADQRGLAVLAHHLHLREPPADADEARAWVGDRPVRDVVALLAAQRAADPREVNAITGLGAAQLLAALVAGEEAYASLPGPLGLPGGYPVRLRGAELELRLPAGLDRADAVAWNQRMADLDGVRVADGRVIPSAAGAEALERYLPDVARGWPARDTPAVAAALLDLRTRLRTTGPASGPRTEDR